MIANVGQRSLDPIVAPGWILLGQFEEQVDNDLASTRTSHGLAAVTVVPFLCDQFTMPAQDRVRREQRADFLESLRWSTDFLREPRVFERVGLIDVIVFYTSLR